MHIYECTEIWNIREINHLVNQINQKIPKYENILNGDVQEMIKVAKIIQIIQANVKIQEKAKDKDWLWIWMHDDKFPGRDHVTD